MKFYLEVCSFEHTPTRSNFTDARNSSELGGAHLIFIELAVFVLLLALVLEGDDNETNEDVHHEECDDDDVDDVVGGHDRPEVVNWSMIFLIGVDRPV